MNETVPTLASVWEHIDQCARDGGAVGVGACDLADPHVRHFESWLARKLEAGMAYLRRNLAVRQEPTKRFPHGRSAVVVLVPYPSDRPLTTPDNIASRIARYAQGDDYHNVVDDLLKAVESTIKRLAPGTWTWRYVDTGPLSDRSLAVQAGLGWIGRNGMLIDPETGSWHFIGVLLTSLENDLESAEVVDRCGECTACVTACPTNAILPDRLVDSHRCVSYLTIEHRGAFSDDVANLDFAGNVFGCDVCQEVCPWNAHPPASHPSFETRDAYRNTPVHDLLRMSQRDFSTMFRKSAVKRARRAGMIRNTLTVAGATADEMRALATETDEGICSAVERIRNC